MMCRQPCAGSVLAASLGLSAALASPPLIATPIPHDEGRTVAPKTTEQRVDALFAPWDRTDSPGAAVGVVRDGNLVYARGYGMANLELGVRLTPQSVFDVGPAAEPFTAMAIHKLVGDGRLSLDDDIRKFLPELPAFAQPILVRHLLEHTSGLRDYVALMELSGVRTEDIATAADVLQMLARQKALSFEPGSSRADSASDYFLLALLAQRAGGSALPDLATSRILRPLGMLHSQFLGVSDAILPGRVAGHKVQDGRPVRAVSNLHRLGDGGFFSTVEDLALFARALEDPKWARLAGLPGEYRGLKTIRHGGRSAGQRAELLRFPDAHLTVVILANLESMEVGPLARRVADLYLESEMRKLAPAALNDIPPLASLEEVESDDPSDLERYTGVYEGDAGFLFVTRLRTLRAELGGRGGALKPIGPGRFELATDESPEVLAFTKGKTCDSVRLEAAGEPPTTFKRVRPWRPQQADLADFAGLYWSPELNTTYRLEWRSQGLVLDHRAFEATPLRPARQDTLEIDGHILELRRNAQGRAAGFQIRNRKIRGIHFERIETKHGANRRFAEGDK